MATKLIFKDKFTLEIPRETETFIIKGTMRPLTKEEQKDFEKMFNDDKDRGIKLQRKSAKIQRLSARLEIAQQLKNYEKQDKILDEMEILEDEIIIGTEELQNLDTHEKTAKERLKISVICETPKMMEELVNACDLVGHKRVLDTILEDIEDGKKQDSLS